jgi:outer membrane cobalamin receptor
LKANRYFIVIWLLFTFISKNSVAQNPQKILLENYLIALEQQFDVVFTYADENVQGIHIVPPKKEIELEKILSGLADQTDLDFEKLNARYIAVKRRKADIIISGTIMDKTTREVLPGAFIFTENSSTLSDENGKFSIAADRQNDSTLIIRYTGYNILTLNKSIWLNDSSIYLLEPNIIAMEEVVVNYLAKGIDKLPDGSIQLNVRNLEVLPGLSEPDVLRSVQVLPGILSVNGTVSNINTRGGTNDQNLVLWDGIKMYQTGHFFGLISAFNSHLIHTTKIVKNGSSVLFDEGISGTILMQQQDYPVNKFEVDAGVNLISADAIVKAPFGKKLSMILSARHSINNILTTPTYRSYYNRAFDHTEIVQNRINDSIVDDFRDFSFYDVSFKLLYDLSERDKIRLSFLQINNTIKYEESILLRDTLFSKKSSLDQSSILSGLNYTRTWSDKHTTQVSAFVSNYLLDGTNVALASEQNHMQENEVLDWGLRLNSEYQINPDLGLTYGYQFNEIGIRNQDNINKPDYYREVKDVLIIHSIYSEAEAQALSDKLYFRFGLRANYFPEFGALKIEPRGVLTYGINQHISLELLAESKSQHTTQLIDYQTDFLGIEKRRWALSNNFSIPIIESRQLSLGTIYNRNNFLFSIEGYLKKISGIISPSQGFQNQFQYTYAIGDYNSKGIELLVNKRFIRSNIWTNYTLARNDYYFREFTPSAFPNNLDIRHMLSVGASYTVREFEVSGGFNYRTGRPYTRPDMDNQSARGDIVYESPNSARLADYIRLDLSVKYNFEIKRINGTVGVSFWNIFNKENVINKYYIRNDNDEVEEIIQHALKFTPNMNLRIYF